MLEGFRYDVASTRQGARQIAEMCGRFTQDLDEDSLDELYELNASPVPSQFRSRWNGAPTQEFVVCRTGPSGQRELALHRWGLIPSWARDPKFGARMINARSETVGSKPSFRAAFRKRRCLVPANGWFEWQSGNGAKVPWSISYRGQPFSFAGLWEYWKRGERPIWSFTILTCPASDALSSIHHRQPVIIPRDQYRAWLGPGPPGSTLLDLVRTPRAGPFECTRVSPAVNNPRNDFAEILRPAG